MHIFSGALAGFSPPTQFAGFGSSAEDDKSKRRRYKFLACQRVCLDLSTFFNQFPRHQAKAVRRRNHGHIPDRAGTGDLLDRGKRCPVHPGALVRVGARGSGRAIADDGGRSGGRSSSNTNLY